MTPLELTLGILATQGHHAAPSGAGYVTTCPFHNERTPSFHVFDDGRCRCFGACGRAASFTGPRYLWLAIIYGVKDRYTPAEQEHWRAFADEVRFTAPIANAVHTPRADLAPDPATRAVAQAVFAWARWQLLRDTPPARDALAYWRWRGLPPACDRFVGCIPAGDAAQAAVLRLVKQAAGDQWREAGAAGNFLDQYGRVRVGDRPRLILADPDPDGTPRFYQMRRIPTGRNTMGWAETAFDQRFPKYLGPKGWTAPVTVLPGVNLQRLDVSEGLIDALTNWTAGCSVACCYGGSNGYRLADTVRAWIGNGATIRVWEDPNTAGAAFTRAIRQIAHGGPIEVVHTPGYLEDANTWKRLLPEQYLAVVARPFTPDEEGIHDEAQTAIWCDRRHPE